MEATKLTIQRRIHHKPEFCAMHCGIILCRKRRENGYKYCDECPDYPCEDVMEKENRYRLINGCKRKMA